jgi:hypothetical protein
MLVGLHPPRLLGVDSRFSPGCIVTNAEVSMFPWEEPKEPIPLAVFRMRSFLRAHRPASAQRTA